jgi:hypothetical protein
VDAFDGDAPLAWRLGGCKFGVAQFSYRSIRRPGENAAGSSGFARPGGSAAVPRRPQPRGLTILAALNQSPGLRARRIVLLGVPYNGIGAAEQLGRFRFGRSLLGRSIGDALNRPSPSPPADVELGVIAGDVPAGMGRLVARLPGPNDGVVRVDETRVPGARDAVVLHVSHSGMLVSAAVARATCAFLGVGLFGAN